MSDNDRGFAVSPDLLSSGFVDNRDKRISALEAENARLRAALLLVENDEEGYCLWCDGFYEIGHTPDCQRQAALAQTAQEVKHV